MKLTRSAIAAILLAGTGVTAQAGDGELSGNIGYDSEYIFRGVPQSDSSANGGVDWVNPIGDSDFGYYFGVWAADVDPGLEIDYYGGITLGLGDVELLAGYTYYDYTDDFDDTYTEFNFGLDWSFLSFAAALGEYDNFTGPTQDYRYFELTLENNGFFATIGSFGDDFDGEFVQLGYGTTIATVDVSASWIYSNADLLGDKDQSIIIQASKGFSFEQVANAWRGLAN